MVRLLTPSPRRRARQTRHHPADRNRFLPSLERLEIRACPACPVITLNVVYLQQRYVQFSGQVTESGSPLSGLTVTITGKATGTATTGSNGSYSVILQASALGGVHATTVDGAGQASNDAVVTLTSNAPIIESFTATQAGNVWTFTGQVSDASPAGETVTLGGLTQLQGQTCTVGSNGWFTFQITLPSGTDGTVSAVDTNWWGQQSEDALTNVVSQ
jgi:hypothetical protein